MITNRKALISAGTLHLGGHWLFFRNEKQNAMIVECFKQKVIFTSFC